MTISKSTMDRMYECVMFTLSRVGFDGDLESATETILCQYCDLIGIDCVVEEDCEKDSSLICFLSE